MSYENTILKSLVFWSTINVRGVYVSNNSFNLHNLPKEMSSKLNEPSNNTNIQNFVDMIIRNPEEEEIVDEEKNKQKKEFTADEIIDLQSVNELDKKSKEFKEESVRRSRDNFRISKKSNESTSKKKNYDKIDYDFKEVQNEILKKNVKIFFKKY